ncbi:hypothetical protein D3C73_854210 [compost metagenome]
MIGALIAYTIRYFLKLHFFFLQELLGFFNSDFGYILVNGFPSFFLKNHAKVGRCQKQMLCQFVNR